MELSVNDQVIVLDGGRGSCELLRSYRVVAEAGEEINLKDFFINADGIEFVSKIEELLPSKPGNVIQAKIPSFPGGDLEVLKVKARIRLLQPVPALVFQHVISRGFGIEFTYKFSIHFPFSLNRDWDYELESKYYASKPPISADLKVISLPEIKIPVDEVRINLKVKSTSPLPVLHELGSRSRGTFSEVHIVMIPHLLEDFPHFTEALIKAGAQKENIYIIGIPYSAQPPIAEELRNEGFPNVIVPPSYPFKEHLTSAGDWLLERFRNKREGFKWLIIEDGGYFFPFLYEQARSDEIWIELKSKCCGAVEQTRNGVWAYQDLVPWNERDTPLCSVADARLKLECESRWIGKAVYRNIDNLIRTAPVRPKEGDKVLVIGLGSTGRQIAKKFRENGWDVKGYDKSSAARAIARGEGILIHNDLNPGQMMEGVRIVIGATGKENSIDKDLIRSMANGTIIVNASSKRREIDWNALGVAGQPEQIGALSLYYFPDRYGTNRLISVLANGFPVNFYSGRSVEPADIELIMSCLFRAAVELIKDCGMPAEKRIFSIPPALGRDIVTPESQKQHGIFILPNDIEEEIADIWLRT